MQLKSTRTPTAVGAVVRQGMLQMHNDNSLSVHFVAVVMTTRAQCDAYVGAERQLGVFAIEL